MEQITLQQLNNIAGAANFVVPKLVTPGATTVFTAQFAVLTQIGTTTIAVMKQSSQAQAQIPLSDDITFEVDGSVLALTAKIDGFLLALGNSIRCANFN
jgi:hypothetical protein